MKTSERIATMPEHTQAIIRELASMMGNIDTAKARLSEWLQDHPKCKYWEQLAIVEQATALAQEQGV